MHRLSRNEYTTSERSDRSVNFHVDAKSEWLNEKCLLLHLCTVCPMC